MTTFEREVVNALAACRLQPLSSDKRFVVSVGKLKPETSLSEKQLAWLHALGWKYRKQLLRHGVGIPDTWRNDTHSVQVNSLEENKKLEKWIEASK